MARTHHSKTYWLSVITLVTIFIVNTLGFTDTVTGSAMGCGKDWPLCNGQLVPSQWNSAVVIEYTHRISVLVGGGLLIALAVAAWWKYGSHRMVRVLVLLSLAGVVMEGALGALAVLFVNPPVVMAAHMGIALISLVAVWLLTSVIHRAESVNLQTHAALSPSQQRHLRQFSRLAWWSIPYGYIAIYIGAYVASTGAGSSFQGWPLPTESIAAAGGAFWIDVLHRSVALGYLLLLSRLAILAHRMRKERRMLWRFSVVALTLVCLQALSGGLLIATHLSAYAFLLHVTNVSCLYAVQCHLGLMVWQERRMHVNRTHSATQAAIVRHRTGA